jgi:2-dehydro-3-deoxyphosphogluconate aldolase/(4S)-4-hydroxy-2-oxoglutarate aldolase
MSILDRGRLVGIVRFRIPGDLTGTVDSLAEGGIPILEVTLDTPGALGAIARVAATGRPVGAGTVLRGDDVRASADAGADFVVSPGLSAEVVAAARSLGIQAIPGVLSPTELMHALALGVTTVKVFPAGPAGGPDYVRALRGPFPEIALVPTGGIAIDDVPGYLAAGAAAVGLGSSLVGSDPPRSARDLEALRARAVAAVELERACP